MDEEISLISTMDRCPDCGGRLSLETTRPKGGGNIISEVYVCVACHESFTHSALLHSKVESLKVWLSDRMGAEVDPPGFEDKTQTHRFRILVPGVRPSPMLCVSRAAFDDHSVEKIQNDLELQGVPGRLVANPAQHLIYTTMGAVEEYDR